MNATILRLGFADVSSPRSRAEFTAHCNALIRNTREAFAAHPGLDKVQIGYVKSERKSAGEKITVLCGMLEDPANKGHEDREAFIHVLLAGVLVNERIFQSARWIGKFNVVAKNGQPVLWVGEWPQLDVEGAIGPEWHGKLTGMQYQDCVAEALKHSGELYQTVCRRDRVLRAGMGPMPLRQFRPG